MPEAWVRRPVDAGYLLCIELDLFPESSTQAMQHAALNGMCKTLGIDDHDAIMALWRGSGLTSLRPKGRDSREDFSRQMEFGVQTILGLEREGDLIGVVVASHDGRKGWINLIKADRAKNFSNRDRDRRIFLRLRFAD